MIFITITSDLVIFHNQEKKCILSKFVDLSKIVIFITSIK